MKKTAVFLMFSGFIVLTVLNIFFWQKNKEDFIGKQQSISSNAQNIVTVQKVQAIPLVITNSYIGFVIPIRSVEIKPFISGFIERVLVEGGALVKKNETLFVLEQSQYIAQMDLQLANVMSTSADFENAKIYYERLKNAGDKAVSQSDLDSAKAKFLTAGAAVGAAIANYELAEVMYNYTYVNAPIDGVLGNVTTTKGEYVSPQGSPLAYLIQSSPVRVVFSISNSTYLKEKALNPISPFADKEVRLKLADGRFYELTGQVQFLDNEVTAATDSVQIFADFKNINQTLLPNSYVDVQILENMEQAITIPQKFVQIEKDGLFVWTVNDAGYLVKNQIEVAENVVENSFYLVTKGLENGQLIVTNKSNTINEKHSVQIQIEETQLPKTISVLTEKGNIQ
ncbi:MAG: efflux RND transporter periplasmic adaptor subunit [Alphaproteobacteria bacterium]|nr:efflux RND transporter periplasmic adaptor subunit [Alphaproteobacteria bacterium]